MIDESKPIKASEIVDDPDVVYGFTYHYIILNDTSVRGTFTKMIEAINLMAERGWETISISRDSSGNMQALCRREQRKRKNEELLR